MVNINDLLSIIFYIVIIALGISLLVYNWKIKKIRWNL